MSQISKSFRVSALRRGIIVRANSTADSSPVLAQAATLELANLGFLVDPSTLSGMATKALDSMLEDARQVVGADRNWRPIYPGFPEQVENIDTLTLLVEQILHYWTSGAFLPDYPTVVREGLPLEDMVRTARRVEVLTAASAARGLVRDLALSPVALSEDERSLLAQALRLQKLSLAEVAELTLQARNGENLQSLVRSVAEISTFSSSELLGAVIPSCANCDQLLRVVLSLASVPAAAKWEKNYELAANTLANRHARAVRMKKLSKPTRRAILGRLGELTHGFRADALVARQDLWRVVMRAVHPYDLIANEYQRRVADIVHSNVGYRTFNSLVEEAMEEGNAVDAIELLATEQPGNLLRRGVAILRLAKNLGEAKLLADEVATVGSKSTLTTLISAYNGIISANDTHSRVTRVAGLTNSMVAREELKEVPQDYVDLVAHGLKTAMGEILKKKAGPTTVVAIDSPVAVPLVRRDASTSDRVLDRGQELQPVGDGDTLRIFGHWNNNQQDSGYMDIGAVVLDEDFSMVAVSTWNSWSSARDWSTYSGDKLVNPGDSAAEFIDVKLGKLKKLYPSAEWVAMTVQSWSGWPMADVDFIAGCMLRSQAQRGEVFDARSVATAFRPTTQSTQAVPFAVSLKTGKMIWIDSSNGSTAAHMSSSDDSSIGAIVYDEVARPRLALGELALMWAQAHGIETVDAPAERDQLLALLD